MRINIFYRANIYVLERRTFPTMRAAIPFVTSSGKNRERLYLRIALEVYLKQLVVGGLNRLYEVGKQFRNEDIDRTHHPEFTS